MSTQVEIEQGSAEWHELRITKRTASNAGKIMKCSPYGGWESLAAFYDGKDTFKGNAATSFGTNTEPKAREVLNMHLDADYKPTIFIDGDYMASLDGYETENDTILEIKCPVSENSKTWLMAKKGEIEKHYYWQIQHQLMVAKSDLAYLGVYMNGGIAIVTVKADSDAQFKLMQEWDAFFEWYKKGSPKPEAVAEVNELPLLVIEIKGEVLKSNLPDYTAQLNDFVAAENRIPKNDDEFARAEKVVKFCDANEKQLDLIKKMALSQTASLEALFAEIDACKSRLSTLRLELDRNVTLQKTKIKNDLINEHQGLLDAHITKLNADLGSYKIPAITPSFELAIKGKRNMDSMKSALNDELKRCMELGNEYALGHHSKIKHYENKAANHTFLFQDLQTLLDSKAADDFALIVNTRIDKYIETEAQKAEADAMRLAQALAEEKAAEAVKAAQQEPVIEVSDKMIESPSAIITASPSPSPELDLIVPTKQDVINTITSIYKMNPTDALQLLTSYFSN